MSGMPRKQSESEKKLKENVCQVLPKSLQEETILLCIANLEFGKFLIF
jgi:hypothetical protein